MKQKTTIFLAGIFLLNILLVSLPLGIKNHQLKKTNQQLKTNLKAISNDEDTSFRAYLMINEIGLLLEDKKLAPLSQNICLTDHLTYQIVLPLDKEKLRGFCDGLQALSGKVYLTEGSIDLSGLGQASLVLQYYGESNE